jgi:hypothetical protein
MPALPLGPKVIRRLVEGLPEPALDERPDPERFSVREVLAHLADWESIFLERMRTAYTTPGIPIEGMDEGERAIAQNYAASDVIEQLELFEARRSKTVSFLRGLAPTDWQKAYSHSERGEVRIEDQANFLLGHDLYHIEQISALAHRH